MNDDPLIIFFSCLIALYLASCYFKDIKAYASLNENPKALPGARNSSFLLIGVSVLIGLVLLFNALIFEQILNLSNQQRTIVWYALFGSIAAGLIEEVVFRGYLVIDNRGKLYLILSCIFFSLIFSLLHGYLWTYEEGLKWNLNKKSIFDSYILFLNSLVFYFLRFGLWNNNKSILPPIAAHISFNIGVFAIKHFQGFLVY